MINQLLINYINRDVNPDINSAEQVDKSQKTLREILNNKLKEDSSLPFLLEDEIFLFGSAKRGTKPEPIDDVDLMLVLDGSMLVANENGRQVGLAVGSGKNFNPVLSREYLDENGFVSSQKILNKIRKAVDETYSRSEIRKDGQAVNLWMDSYGFGIDIVPAFKINHVFKGAHYFIPIGTNSHVWQSTNPLIDLRLFGMEDGRLNGLLCNSAKLMRKWNELQNNNILSGFHIDAMVYRSLFGKNITSLEHALLTCLNNFGNLLTVSCQQFTDYGYPIDHKLTYIQRTESKRNVSKSKAELISAAIASLPNVVSPYRHQSKLLAWNNIFNKELLKK